ncbi:MAG TPA: ATP-dependent DNA helicase [Candidatus Paceibacterota bacterium]|nr:ATP-dependent DNA helicase [Candidatus Paceibacterota bacterium]HQF40887.1 ATP-dependent DNA helicase [Candidatus Paceibacterota bacterium]
MQGVEKAWECYNLGMNAQMARKWEEYQARFNEAYNRLNSAQKEAVDTIEGPVMVIAGPGTGKTQILALRVANILYQTDTPPSGILALTFTEAGQKAMRLKLRQFIGSAADEIGVYTYHGFASAVMAEFGDHFPHLRQAKQLTEVEAETLIREILRAKRFSRLRPLGDPDFYVGKIIKAISDCRKEAWTPEMIADFAAAQIEVIKNDPASISSRGATKGQLKADALKKIDKAEKTKIFAEVYATYEEKKKIERRIDFDDLIFELTQALEQDELLLRLLQEKYLYILVDEHQDTNDAQNALIKKIADFYEEPNLFVVGDEKQAIYRFQGASVQNFLRFQSLWPAMKVISLENNYRSHQGILDACFGLIENNYQADEYPELRIRLKSANGEEPEPVEVVMAGNVAAAEKYLADEIKKVLMADDKATVAVITKTNRDVENALRVLETAGVPAAAERGADVFGHPLGRLFFALAEYLADAAKTESLAYALSGGLWGLDLFERAEVMKNIRSGNLKDLDKKLSKLSVLKEKAVSVSAVEFLILVGEESGLVALTLGDPLSMEVWRSIVALGEDLARTQKIEDPILLIEAMLSFRQTAENKSVKIMAGFGEARVRIMTAHGSKGLEFDYVFLPYATEESWMSRGFGNYFLLPESKEENDDLRDARRLFYVALTRARHRAVVVVGLADGMKRTLTPLRFIDELDQENVARTSLPALVTAPAAVNLSQLAKKDEARLVEFAKNILLEKGLSVTALNHFCECPSKFFFKSILKVPEAPAMPAEKGNAMHEAIAAVWALSEKTEEKITETLKVALQNYFAHSLLLSADKELALEELLLAAPKVAAALGPHFAIKGVAAAEKWVEARFEFKVEKQAVELKIHGKMDAIIDTAEKVLVFDYKTKSAMSEAAIKGETKNDDGNYFRQLIFYKILLAESSFYRGQTIEPALVFVKPDNKGRCPTVSIPIAAEDISRVKGEIGALLESVWTGRILTETCDDPKCEYCQLMNL